MRCLCLGYYDETKWDTMSESEWVARLKECVAYDDALRQNGHVLGGEALPIAQEATTLRWQDGEMSIRSGPFGGTRDELSGFLLLEADDLNHAIQLMSRHPGIGLGGRFEIHPTEDLRLQ